MIVVLYEWQRLETISDEKKQDNIRLEISRKLVESS